MPTAGASAPISCSIRSRISLAARSVNVITSTDDGSAPAATSRRKRSAMTAVFPVPAPAITRSAPSVAAASLWAASNLIARACGLIRRAWTFRCAPSMT